jgi:hypothetical protein
VEVVGIGLGQQVLVPATNNRRVDATGRLIEHSMGWIQHGIVASPTLQDRYRVQCLPDAARTRMDV